MEYPVILEKDEEEEGGFVATCPILRGCVSQGETEEEALENIKDAISLYLAGIEDLKRKGRYRTVIFRHDQTSSTFPRTDRACSQKSRFPDTQGRKKLTLMTDGRNLTIIPRHRVIKTKTLKSILEGAEIAPERFRELL